MSENFFYSTDNGALYPVSLKSRYERAGTWPVNGFFVPDEIAEQFQNDPDRGAREDDGYKGKKIVKSGDGTFQIVVA